MDAGAEGNRIHVPAQGGAGPVLDHARELSVGQPRGRRVPVHAVWNGQRSGGRGPDGRTAVHRKDRDGEDRQVGRHADETAA